MMFSARGLQELVKSFRTRADPSSNAALFHGQFVAVPVLLTFAMELALKAWWARENKDCDVPKTHNLLKLFDGLNENARTRLEHAHPEIPNMHPGLQPIRPGLRSMLASNSATFIEWRYQYERRQGRFPEGEFDEAL